MKTKLITLSVLLLSFITAIAQEDTTNWYQNLHVKTGFASNFGFNSDLNVAGYSRTIPSNTSFRLGLGYDISLNEKWTLSPSAEIDWIRYLDDTSVTTASGADFNFVSSSSFGSDLDLIISAPFQYELLKNNSGLLGIVIAPQFNLRSYTDVGIISSTLSRDGNTINYEATERNRHIRPSLLLGLNYKFRLGSLPIRAQAFYSHSFTPQYFGEFVYSNDFNGETQTGDYEFNGHQAGVSLAFFPFGNGNAEKKERKEKEKKEQTVRDEHIGNSRFGFKAGVNFSDIIGIDEITGEDTGYLGTEIYGGLFIDTKISEHWNLQNEAIFSFTDEFLFLEIPVLFKRKVAKNFWAFGGPKAQIITNESSAVIRNVGLGADFGIQYDLPKDFFIEARYGFGLSEQIGGDFLGITQGKRNVFRIGVGIRF